MLTLQASYSAQNGIYDLSVAFSNH